ncbi:ABC transporter G family member 10-like protein [Trifolium pratense]|uniref:ABC transporter G family member 10-like protein n=1 Tax=Trifolium pratense TaxID=57577 RepID=A0A2K3NR07_TRIPR|nr:ABC transporter G family member 10-like protein [Trifolium pratense]PNY05470.1 ABC transporter G family member 10-like protein [Trifolium pratense]
MHTNTTMGSSFNPISCNRKTSYRLETKNLSYRLSSQLDELRTLCFGLNPQRGSKFILKDVNCEARPGEVTAIAGPSGAGKTTLLEILAGRIPSCKVLGQVLVNHMPMDVNRFRRESGYVTQEDALFPSLTTLMYSALLRLPGGRKAAAMRVAELMKELGLDTIADSRIGNGSDHGISGGEKRRVSIGVDLVHDPAIILIDEPTSGLDSASALKVISLLRLMAFNQGKTVVLTIHQPGFRILELLDSLILLSDGFVMHNGSLNLLEARLNLSGHRIPNHVNVLEFALEAMQTLVIHTSESGNNQFLLNDKNHQDHNMMMQCSMIVKEKAISYSNSPMEEILILGQRFCSNIFRTKQLFVTRVIQALVAGFVLGTIFLNVGNKQSKIALQTRSGFFAFSLTFLLSSTTEGLPIFLEERRTFMRETSRGAYRVSSYVLANTLVFLPFLLLVGLLYTTPVYWLVGLRKDIDGFLYFSLVVWLVLLMSNSLVACFSALVPNFILGSSVIAGLMGSFFLFSGYFISKEKIPSYWIFMHYISLFKYPFECLMINEYGGEQGKRRCIEVNNNGECILYGAEFLKQQGLKESHKWINLALMLSFIIGYRVLNFIILWSRCYKSRK